MQITFFAQVRDIEAYDFRNLHQIVISKLQNLFGGELIPRKTLIRPHYGHTEISQIKYTRPGTHQQSP